MYNEDINVFINFQKNKKPKIPTFYYYSGNNNHIINNIVEKYKDCYKNLYNNNIPTYKNLRNKNFYIRGRQNQFILKTNNQQNNITKKKACENAKKALEIAIRKARININECKKKNYNQNHIKKYFNKFNNEIQKLNKLPKSNKYIVIGDSQWLGVFHKIIKLIVHHLIIL